MPVKYDKASNLHVGMKSRMLTQVSLTSTDRVKIMRSSVNNHHSTSQRDVRAVETSRNITTRVFKCDFNGEIHYFLEESREFRPRQHGCQIGHQLGRQKGCQLSSTAKISLSSH
ncbi:hypothetical protein TNCV_579581 [Trichonephila clavipes]|nr:hypothetical protein TNCV_579581 [Trichonephila clavipes]